MSRYWRLVVVVIILTFTPMHAAWAECAWVLWVAEFGGQPFPVAGYKSIADCEREKQAWEARDGAGAVSPAAAAVSSAFRCLPDTIDARWPTRRGR